MPDKLWVMTLKPTFAAAMISYGVLGLIAGFALDGNFRLLVLVLLAGLAAKTIIARAAGW